jgi:hypothetical protein
MYRIQTWVGENDVQEGHIALTVDVSLPMDVFYLGDEIHIHIRGKWELPGQCGADLCNFLSFF